MVAYTLELVRQMHINQLPPEILEEIFFHAVNGINGLHSDRKDLFLTCKSWYRLVVAQVRLWTTISWSNLILATIRCPNLASFAQIIERTGNAALNLTFELPACRTDPFEFDHLELVNKKQTPEYQGWISRCQSLTLVAHPLVREYDPAATLEAVFGPAGYTFASLECLVLRHVCYSQPPGKSRIFLDQISTSAPNLYRLEIEYLWDAHVLKELFERTDIQERIRELKLPMDIDSSVPWDAMRSLTHLHITRKNTSFPKSVNLRELIAPNLRRIHMEGDFPVDYLPSKAIIKQVSIKLVGASKIFTMRSTLSELASNDQAATRETHRLYTRVIRFTTTT